MTFKTNCQFLTDNLSVGISRGTGLEILIELIYRSVINCILIQNLIDEISNIIDSKTHFCC